MQAVAGSSWWQTAGRRAGGQAGIRLGTLLYHQGSAVQASGRSCGYDETTRRRVPGRVPRCKFAGKESKMRRHEAFWLEYQRFGSMAHPSKYQGCRLHQIANTLPSRLSWRQEMINRYDARRDTTTHSGKRRLNRKEEGFKTVNASWTAGLTMNQSF